jgi:glycosyltransferase involved in cell wall biosynthesis
MHMKGGGRDPCYHPGMRVVYLADAPYIHTKRWIDHSIAQGIECEVITFRPAEIEGANVHYIDGAEGLGKARYLLHGRRIKRLVESLEPDMVHALHLTSYGFLAALTAVHPLVISVWGTDVLEAPNLTPFHRWLTRYALAHADVITATGLHLATATTPFTPREKPVTVVPYGVDLARFKPKKRRVRKKTVIGAVSRLSVEKGVAYLVEAFALLRQRHGDLVTLQIAGNGPEEDTLRTLAKRLGVEESVEFRGWVDHSELPEFLQGLDIFALPSTYEGFGVAAVEASAMALPVVATNVYGIPDVVIDGETGLLVPSKDAEALATALGRLVENTGMRLALGEAGREYVASQYDWQQNIGQMDTIYEQVAGWQRPASKKSTGNDDGTTQEEPRKRAAARPRKPAGARDAGEPVAGRRRRGSAGGAGD